MTLPEITIEKKAKIHWETYFKGLRYRGKFIPTDDPVETTALQFALCAIVRKTARIRTKQAIVIPVLFDLLSSMDEGFTWGDFCRAWIKRGLKPSRAEPSLDIWEEKEQIKYHKKKYYLTRLGMRLVAPFCDRLPEPGIQEAPVLTAQSWNTDLTDRFISIDGKEVI